MNLYVKFWSYVLKLHNKKYIFYPTTLPKKKETYRYVPQSKNIYIYIYILFTLPSQSKSKKNHTNSWGQTNYYYYLFFFVLVLLSASVKSFSVIVCRIQKNIWDKVFNRKSPVHTVSEFMEYSMNLTGKGRKYSV